MKRCPYCAEQIQDEAVVCRYCGRDLESALSPSERRLCPTCNRWITSTAEICRHCLNPLPAPPLSTKALSPTKFPEAFSCPFCYKPMPERSLACPHCGKAVAQSSISLPTPLTTQGALAERSSPDTIVDAGEEEPRLRRLLSDIASRHSYERMDAVDGLASLGVDTPDVITTLRSTALKDADYYVREAACKALKRLGHRPSVTSPVASTEDLQPRPALARRELEPLPLETPCPRCGQILLSRLIPCPACGLDPRLPTAQPPAETRPSSAPYWIGLIGGLGAAIMAAQTDLQLLQSLPPFDPVKGSSQVRDGVLLDLVFTFFGSWLIWGLVLAVIVAVIQRFRHRIVAAPGPSSARATTKQCPFCAEIITAEASVCTCCGRALSPPPTN